MRRVGVWLLALAWLASSSCGYRSAMMPGGERRALHVAVVRCDVPDAALGAAVLAGVRDVLAERAALASGGGFPRVEVELLREDESSEGIAAAGSVPLARGSAVGIVARAWVVTAPGEPPAWDTGDMRAEGVVSTLGESARGGSSGLVDSRGDALAWGEARRAAARRVGRLLAARVLGDPTAGE